MNFFKWILSAALLVTGLAGCLGLGPVQRKLIYFPTHEKSSPNARAAGLTRWSIDGEYTGYARLVDEPRKVWLFLHGNGGQAADRGYVLSHLNPRDAVYILEYPGYGEKPGQPSMAAFNRAALAAYEWLVRRHGAGRLLVLGESLGSGPACSLANAPNPPEHIVLVVPFDVLADVAQEKVSWLPARLLLIDRWDNIDALRGFRGRVDVFGAAHDQVIPVRHARNLAARHPGARYHEFEGDHGWARGNAVDLSRIE